MGIKVNMPVKKGNMWIAMDENGEPLYCFRDLRYIDASFNSNEIIKFTNEELKEIVIPQMEYKASKPNKEEGYAPLTGDICFRPSCEVCDEEITVIYAGTQTCSIFETYNQRKGRLVLPNDMALFALEETREVLGQERTEKLTFIAPLDFERKDFSVYSGNYSAPQKITEYGSIKVDTSQVFDRETCEIVPALEQPSEQ